MFTVEITSMPGVQELLHVLPALLVARAGHVRVRELVDQRDLGRTGEDRVQVHLLERRPSVRERPARHDLEVAELLLRSAGRPWVSTNPTTTSVPRARRR